MTDRTSNERVCTCHPTGRPPICQHRYAATECQDAYRAYKATRVTVSCLCGMQGCNAESCNPTTFKLAIASIEIRDLRAALATRSADETKARQRDIWLGYEVTLTRYKERGEHEGWIVAALRLTPSGELWYELKHPMGGLTGAKRDEIEITAVEPAALPEPVPCPTCSAYVKAHGGPSQVFHGDGPCPPYFSEKATARPIPPGRMCNTHGNWNCSECCPPENGDGNHG